MADSPLGVVTEMVFAVVRGSFDTAKEVGNLFVRFLTSMGLVLFSGNMTAFILSLILFIFVLFVVWKFVLKSWKEILILLVVGVANYHVNLRYL